MQHEENTLPENEHQTEENLVENDNTDTENQEQITIQQNDAENTHTITTTSELDSLKTELTDIKDKYLRIFAEFDNFKKRNAKEKREFSLVASQDIIKDLLPILDDIKRATATYTKDNNAENFAQGVQLIFEKLNKTLQQKGLKEMDSIGTDFDVEKHEAIAEIPAPTEEKKGKILDEAEAGYILNGTIIRYAKVVVGK